MNLKLSPRLEAVVSFVRENKTIADVGCDHCLLSVKIAKEKNPQKIIASDIAQGPIAKAKKCVDKYKLSEIINLKLAKGLLGLEIDCPDDIIIAGMGGELICDILSGSDYIKNPNVKLILQPMTKSESLRYYLSQNGYQVLCEKLVYEKTSGKIYEIIYASYSGENQYYTKTELLIGKYNIDNNSDNLREHVINHIKLQQIKINGMKRASLDTSEEERIKNDLCGVLDGYC